MIIKKMKAECVRRKHSSDLTNLKHFTKYIFHPHDAQMDFFQVLAQIDDKHRRLPEVRARQGSTANTSTLQRLLQSFEQDIQLLVTQVRRHPEDTDLKTRARRN